MRARIGAAHPRRRSARRRPANPRTRRAHGTGARRPALERRLQRLSAVKGDAVAEDGSGEPVPGESARDVDALLASAPGVKYRYALSLDHPRDVSRILQVLEELDGHLSYMLLVHHGAPRRYRAYIGLGSADLFDFPVRMAAHGIRLEGGEEVSGGGIEAPARRGRTDR